MKATLERSQLLRALNHVHRVVERRNTIPILSNLLVRAEAGGLTLKATDLDLEILETVAAEVATPGATTVPAHLLYDIVRKLPEGSEVSLTTSSDGQSMAVSAGRSRFALQILPASDFPDLAAGDLPIRFSVPAAGLKLLIDRTQFAISTEETRYYLNGIYLHIVTSGGAKWLRTVATDGHRLAQAQLAAPDGSEHMPGVIVPRKTVGEIQKLVEGLDTEISVEVSDTKIRVTLPGPGAGLVLTSKLIDGTFPDYARVIPQNNEKILKVDRGELQDAVDRVATISSDRGRAVKLSLAADRLVLSVTNPDSGSATEELGVEFDSEPIEIGFNSRYLLDIGAQLRSATAIFRLADPGSPTLIQDEDAQDALYVLMPMRV